jgi:hypothetical protein
MARKLDAPYSLIEKLINKISIQPVRFVNYEIQYDCVSIDHELLLATAFISIMTRWRKAKGIKKIRPITAAAAAGQDMQPNAGLAKGKALKNLKTKFNRALMTSKGKINGLAVQKAHEAKRVKISIAKLLGKQLPVTLALYYQESLALASCQP